MPAKLATLNALTQALTQGRTSAVQSAQAAMDRADDPAGEGVRVFTHRHAEQTLAAAKASDMLRAAGLLARRWKAFPFQ